MEIAIIGVLAIVVIAAVALPLFRGSAGHADAHEYGTGTEATSPPITTGSPAFDVPVTAGDDAALEAEIARYREAVASGTVCRRCGEANPRDAKFCADCGKPLPRSADAQEYA